MWQRRARTSKRNSYGVAPIRRDTYNTVNGFSQKNGWFSLNNEVVKRSGGRCEAYTKGIRCANKGKEAHHIVPLSAGGSNTKSNMIHLCQSCHDRRHNHLFRSRKA